MNTKTPICYVLLYIILLTSCTPPNSNRDHITGTFTYIDDLIQGGTTVKEARPIAFAKVEIHSFAPRGAGGIWSWGLDRTVTTDKDGSISVPLPWPDKGVVYAVKVFATNYAAIVWPNDVAHTVPFHREPGQPGSPINRKYGTDILDFTYEFKDDWTTQHYNIAETVRLGYDYARDHRDPKEKDQIPPVNIQPTSVSIGNTFYDPAIDTLTIDSGDVFDDFVLLHEYAHFLEEQISSFPWIPSDHNGCTSSIKNPVTGVITIINSPEQAWMEGFADYFARAVEKSLSPKSPLAGPSMGTPDVATLENQPSPCPNLPAGYAPETIENRVAGTLWDLIDPVGTSSNEPFDTIADRDLDVFQIFDRELDTYGKGPTICAFYNAWVARGLDKVALDSILSHNGITSCQNPPPIN